MFGNLPPHPAAVAAVQKVLQDGTSYSYGTSYGYQIAREAIAKQFSTPDRRPLTQYVSVWVCVCVDSVCVCVCV